MIDIKTECDGKVWKALQFMSKGIKKALKSKTFLLDMATFGSTTVALLNDKEKIICVGCAATVTIQELAHKRYTKDVLSFVKKDGRPDWSKISIQKAKFIQIEHSVLQLFENAIDDARVGILHTLFDFIGKSNKHNSRFDYLFCFTNGNRNAYGKNLIALDKLIMELKKLDI